MKKEPVTEPMGKVSLRMSTAELLRTEKEARRRGMTFSQLVRLLVREGIAK